jgi:diguanylate cyclase (GGDEF)-like protein
MVKHHLVRQPLLQRVAGVLIGFTLVMLAWLVVKPGSPGFFAAGDNILQTIGMLLGAGCCFLPHPQKWANSHARASRWVPLLLGLGLLSGAIGQAIFTYYEQIVHQLNPFPSWSDIGYLGLYPFLLVGVLLLPTKPVTPVLRMRVVFDGVMILVTIITLSWYFILGPTILQGDGTLFAKIVGAAYPIADLVIAFCLFLLAAHFHNRQQRLVLVLLMVSLAIIVATDCLWDYLTLHNAYATGGLLDCGWPLGYMLLGFTALVSRAVPVQPEQERADAPMQWSWWQTMFPYMLASLIAVLFIMTLNTPGNSDAYLVPGVRFGVEILIGIIVVRQILALREVVVANKSAADLNQQLRQNHEELARKNAQLEALATTDPLTCLPNHRAIAEICERELERGQRFQKSCGVLFIDLDHFKALNDGYGHPAGDMVLQEFAAAAQATLRKIDVLGRWGGEEFLAILPQVTAEELQTIAERLRMTIASQSFSVGGGIHVTSSIGGSLFPRDGETRDALVAMADQAVQAAKQLGRNQVRLAGDPLIASLQIERETMGNRETHTLMGIVDALAALVEARDSYTGEHTTHVGKLTLRIALALGLTTSEARMLAIAGRLHDIGKVAIPDAILCKPSALSEEEWQVMRTHPTIGAEIVGHIPGLRVIAPIVQAHHERWDGAGYPAGLVKENIPLGARIITVVDAFDAITTDRPYQKARDASQALEELYLCAGSQFDLEVVQTLERVLHASEQDITPQAA